MIGPPNDDARVQGGHRAAVEVNLETLAAWIATLRVVAEVLRAHEWHRVQQQGGAVDQIADALEQAYIAALR